MVGIVNIAKNELQKVDHPKRMIVDWQTGKDCADA